jgi:hypothetical protein
MRVVVSVGKLAGQFKKGTKAYVPAYDVILMSSA